MITAIIYIISLAAEALIFQYYASHLFELKRSKTVEWLAITVGYSLLLGVTYIMLPGINLIAFIIVNYFLIFMLYKISWGSCIFHTFILMSLMSFCELAILGLSNQFTMKGMFDEPNYLYTAIAAFSGKLLYYITARLIVSILRGKKAESRYSGGAAIILNIIPFISFFMIVSIVTVLLTADISIEFRYMLSGCAVLLLFINVLIFFIYHYLGQKNAEYTSLQLQLQKENDLERYYKALSKQDENQHILIHDIKNHLITLSNLNDNSGGSDEVKEYLNEMLNSKTLRSSVRLSDNTLLNAILCQYVDMCQENNINFITDIRKNLLKDVDYSDLTALFCNLLDNAYNACPKEEGSYIELIIEDKNNTAITHINLINTCPDRPVFNKKGIPVSASASSHGYGIKSIERVVKKYNGEYEMYYNDEKREFHVIIALQMT